MDIKKNLRICFFSFSIILLIGGIAVFYAIEHILPYSPIRPYRISREEVQRMFIRSSTPADFSLHFQNLDILVEDTLHLRGWYIYARTASPLGTVILLHGIGSCKESWLPAADTLARHGFHSILLDLRAHGESDGTNCTFGYYEKKDISAVISEVQRRVGPTGPLAVYGHSLGAALAVQVMASDPRIACGIVISPFADLRETLHDYSFQMLGVHAPFVVNAALKNSERIAGFCIDSVRPEEDARLIHRPVMVIHGSADEKIPVEYGQRIYSNIPSPSKEWYGIEGGDHDHLSRIGGNEYYKRIIAFLTNHIRP